MLGDGLPPCPLEPPDSLVETLPLNRLQAPLQVLVLHDLEAIVDALNLVGDLLIALAVAACMLCICATTGFTYQYNDFRMILLT